MKKAIAIITVPDDYDWEASGSLRPLPQKNKYDVNKYATVDYENNITLGHYLNKGWNDCLDEIVGETE